MNPANLPTAKESVHRNQLTAIEKIKLYEWLKVTGQSLVDKGSTRKHFSQKATEYLAKDVTWNNMSDLCELLKLEPKREPFSRGSSSDPKYYRKLRTDIIVLQLNELCKALGVTTTDGFNKLVKEVENANPVI